jgi:uncharacterized protein YecE (DUF72 family)
MKVYVGTSGWYYPWNRKKTLDWYITNSRLNAVELNASFYRFPFPNMVKSWKKKGASLRWVVKVNQVITHRLKFSSKCDAVWKQFKRLFSPMDDIIDFFLFQLPPHMTPVIANAFVRFIKDNDIAGRCALEPRNNEWFTDDMIEWAKALGVTWVSVDTPQLPRNVIKTARSVYVRMHGRTAWYNHDYGDRELRDIRTRIMAAKPSRVYIFFNNDTNMLANAQCMAELFRKR